MELKSYANLLFFEAIETVYSRDQARVITYLNKSIKWKLRQKMIEDLRKPFSFSLEEKIMTRDSKMKDSKKEKKENITYADPIDTEYVGEEMLQHILSLTEEEQRMILLKYQKCYTSEEIASGLNMSLEEVDDIEQKALNRLRQNLCPVKVDNSKERSGKKKSLQLRKKV